MGSPAAQTVLLASLVASKHAEGKSTMRIAFLGLGLMGSAIASRIAHHNHEFTVWNRTASATEPLVHKGARAASSAADAVKDADLVFTMLLNDSALESVLFEYGVLDAMEPEAIHISLSTISVALAERLETEHQARGQHLVGAPVFGRPNVAEEGKLWIAAGGQSSALSTVRPLLETFSRGITVVGDRASLAHAVKIGGNFLITAMIASLSEGVTFAEAHGIDAAVYLEVANSALFQSPFYAAYTKVMLHPPETVAATVKLGQKDMNLFREAAQNTDTPTPLADVFGQQFQKAMDGGEGNSDWAAGYLQQVRAQANAHEKITEKA
jgi:3-hydroxyisobutyrate dehydrogenase-like beta-hydroxyacid dehydrogenase